jgi:hypothetical protein
MIDPDGNIIRFGSPLRDEDRDDPGGNSVG